MAPGRLELANGDAVLTLAPETGGGVAGLSWRGVELFRPATRESLESNDPLGLGDFPLVPFAGRLTRGRFVFDGRSVALPPNLDGETDAIHGQGWRAPWRVAEADRTTARLVFDHAASDWPWHYRAEQTFVLEDQTLVHALAVTNSSTRPMPAGLGLHPYFPRDADTRLEAEITGVYLSTEGPAAPLPAEWDWRGGRVITAFVDHQFAGWMGSARITWPSRNLSLSMSCDSVTPYLVVYAPTGRHHVCVEPVSHRLDAVNRSPGGAGEGMVVLAPGQTTRLSVRFAWEDLRIKR